METKKIRVILKLRRYHPFHPRRKKVGYRLLLCRQVL